jgi:hypothetical protein
VQSMGPIQQSTRHKWINLDIVKHSILFKVKESL